MTIPRMLPIDPLIPWINEGNKLEGTEAFAARCGVSAKRMADFTAGRVKRISFDSLDKLLACEGGRTIIDFFPEYDEDSFADLYRDAESSLGKKANDKGCSVDGCDRAHHSKGLCSSHYKRARKKAAKVAA